MVAAVEARDTEASMFSRRMIPWHNLGTVVPDDVTSRDEVLRLSKLANWNLQFGPFSSLLPRDCDTHLNLRAVIRNNPYYDEELEGTDDYTEKPYNVLGVVGTRYQLVTNEELAEFAEQLLVGGRWETAGSLKYGTLVFMSMALNSKITIDEKGVNETIDNYLVVSNGHDGEHSLTAYVTPIRPVCQNTLNWGLKSATQKITIRHTKSLQDKMNEAVRVLGLTKNYTEEFESSANALFQTKITDAEFDKIIKTAYPEPEESATKTAFTRWNNNIDSLYAIWESDTIEGIKNTKWGAINALEEWQQWGRKVYSDDTEKFWSAATGFEKEVNHEKTKLFQMVSAF